MAPDKNWAPKYLLDPLTAPEPIDETGPGTHFRRPDSVASSSRTTLLPQQTPPNRNPFNAYPSPPYSASPRTGRFSAQPSDHRRSSSSNYEHHQRGRSSEQVHASTINPVAHGRRRGSSLSSRFPGDKSHQPLDLIRRDTKRANRAPHLNKRHLPGPDTIDSLDNVGAAYHHEGPYDATLMSRNKSPLSSPVAAVSGSNAETLKATPREKIDDSLRRHRPLDGTAVVPPGMRDLSGRQMQYEEGTDMMIEDGGNYKRWPGVEYHPDDLKGKGEPSYTADKLRKEQKAQRRPRVRSEGADGYEMRSDIRPATASGDVDTGRRSGQLKTYSEWDNERRQGDEASRHGSGTGQGLKKRFGSLRKKHVLKT
ncbi:MAG: hypothetical protein M1817_005103 [Caeruleum heppii]|nr:MAG: hypothetical protein M1817_005103 [Caeruleum heppii]